MQRTIPLSAIRFTAANPRTNGDDAIAALAASLDMGLAQPPVVWEYAAGAYEIITGERRVRAARAAGWETIPVLVETEDAPYDRFLRRIAENLHRQELSPLDEARVLKLDWLLLNARALLAEDAMAQVFAAPSVLDQLGVVQRLLTEAGWSPQRPVVTQDTYLAQRGFGITKAALRKKLQVLNLSPEAEVRLGDADLTEAGVRSFLRLNADDQRVLLGAIEETPDLARSARTIVQWVNDPRKQRSMADAIAIARGDVPAGAAVGSIEGIPVDGGPAERMGGDGLHDEPAVAELVLPIMDIRDQLVRAMAAIQAIPIAQMPDPWNIFLVDAMTEMKKVLADVA